MLGNLGSISNSKDYCNLGKVLRNFLHLVFLIYKIELALEWVVSFIMKM
jgi:hypothetical protein